MYQTFTNKFPTSKTISMELKPVGRTSQTILEDGILEKDEAVAEGYKTVKKGLDLIHRDFINQMMKQVNLSSLEEYFEVYERAKTDPKNKELKANLEQLQTRLRQEIIAPVAKKGLLNEQFEDLFSAKLFPSREGEGLLINFLRKTEGNEDIIANAEMFEKFSGYFTNFHTIRKKLYTSDKKHNTLAYRLVHENLPRFIENREVLLRIKNKNPMLFATIKEKLDENNFDLEPLMDLDWYQSLLTQEGITAYNTVISGKTVGAVIPEATIKLQGINEIVNNEHNQFSDKQDKVPKLKPLHKQILSDETSVSFIAKGFEDDVELCDTVNSFYLARISTLEKLQLLFGSFADFDMNRIIITNKSLNNLSKAVYGDFSLLRRAVTYFYENQIEPDFEAKLESAKSEKAKVKLLAQKEFFVESNHSIEFLEKAVSFYQEGRENKAPESAIQQFFATILIKDNNPIKVARATYNYLKGFLEKGVNGAQWKEGGKELLKLKDKQEITELKKMLDALMDVYHFARLLETTDEITENKDEVFYAELAQFKDEFGNMPALYDKVRNYITQKPYTKDKIKLNFGSATLLGGWDKNKEKTNLSTLLRKDGLYYLAIFKQDYRNVFDGMPVDSAGANFEKMVYKYIPSPSKMLPKVFLSKKGIATFHPPKHLLENYEKGTHKKGDDFNLEHCHELIDFFKKSLFAHEEWKHFGFEFSETKTYKDLSDFYRELEPQGYHVKFQNISEEYVLELVEQGKLYLFQLYNKDFSKYATGKDKLFTKYFKGLFTDENLKDPVYKLSGSAEIFYRKASIEKPFVHKAGEGIKSKNPLRDKVSVFEYDMVKDRRFTQDKFFLHMPLVLNFNTSNMTAKAFNQEVNETIKKAETVNVIGIDRGEKNLLYISVINEKGEILEQKSLNNITSHDSKNGVVKTPYHTLLDQKQRNRQKARSEWKTIDDIKNLKEGYLGHVIGEVVRLMVKYNAVLAIENLDSGFKKGRLKFEKQVYQKFENALINKLNYLVLNDKADNEIGGARKAYQLTTPASDMKYVQNQAGFMFYVSAWNTTRIDPTTGFVDLLRPRYENMNAARNFINKFDAIRYNFEQGYFEFEFNYGSFDETPDLPENQWVVCSHGSLRYVYDNKANDGMGALVAVNINKMLLELFKGAGINLSKDDLIEDICKVNKKEFFETLMYCLKVLLMIRYSNPTSDEDFVLSPVKNAVGVFFDSREAKAGQPCDGDANDAFNIAMKGLWAVKQIKQATEADKIKISPNKQEWLAFSQSMSETVANLGLTV